jgi:hypothetical protein
MNRGARLEPQILTARDKQPNFIEIADGSSSSHVPCSPLRVMGIDGEGCGPVPPAGPDPPRYPFKRGALLGVAGGFPRPILDYITTSFRGV